MKRLILILIFITNFTSCQKSEIVNTEIPIENKSNDYWNWFHIKSEEVYDGLGEWGGEFYGFRDVLRNTYWRAESYAMLVSAGHNDSSIYQNRVSESIAFLLQVQELGGTGVFGIPNEFNHPEFGTVIRQINSEYPEGINNGWISDLPTEYLPELYYDHGYALSFLSREYTRTQNSTLLPSINLASNWILSNFQETDNDNYLSAISKGLSYAYEATGNQTYLNKAIEIHENYIFPNQMPDGRWNDVHNRRLVYHSFICSGLIALKKVIPIDNPSLNELDMVLEKALNALISEINIPNALEFDGKIEGWPGSCIITLIELNELRELSQDENFALEKIVDYLILNRNFIEENISTTEASVLMKLSAPIGMYVSSEI